MPRTVLARAALLETALPLAPALLLAGVGGTAVYLAYAGFVGAGSPPLLPLLVPVAVYAACLPAGRGDVAAAPATHPAELRST
ncbi:hypothetical protein [Streptomyces sp. NBC_00887]|uniref:hypothetical protein n=1 Tax=Streptomyces sp. NBC_00887 TaxID=2975859 RepID=UPI003866C056|nr:hypothetical protein OG844_15000 [Streptomyces sp. NBC_00887]